VLTRHGSDIDRRRDALLEQVRRHGPPNLTELSETRVLPVTSTPTDPDGGLECLQIIGETMARPTRFAEILRSTLRACGLTYW
jgi:hypothetical protein